MATHIALLRGINVGGNNKVPMAELRQIMADLGHTDVATYIQSGNVVFTTNLRDTTALARTLETAVEASMGVSPRVVVLSRDELAQVVEANPYADETNHKVVHAFFLSTAVGREVTDHLAELQGRSEAKGSRDRAQAMGRVVYLHTPDGFGRSELATLLGRSRTLAELGATARNWATVTTLLSMCDA
jgi:uncharacterized protein (DUF1697 family)